MSPRGPKSGTGNITEKSVPRETLDSQSEYKWYTVLMAKKKRRTSNLYPYRAEVEELSFWKPGTEESMNDSMPDERRYKFLTISIPPPEDSADQSSPPVALDIRQEDGKLLISLRFMENIVSIRTLKNGEIKYLGTYLRDEGRISLPQTGGS